MKKSQQGFAVVVIFALLLVIGVIGGAGLLAWHNSQKRTVASKKAVEKISLLTLSGGADSATPGSLPISNILVIYTDGSATMTRTAIGSEKYQANSFNAYELGKALKEEDLQLNYSNSYSCDQAKNGTVLTLQYDRGNLTDANITGINCYIEEFPTHPLSKQLSAIITRTAL